jgi:hypothetical protein
VSGAPAQRWLLVAVAVMVVTTGFRFLTLTGFPNDHFTTLTPAWQMAATGDLPIADFQDQGHPLMVALSALMQALLGPTLLSEAILVVVAFGIAAVLTLFLVRDLTGSLLLAVSAVAFEIAIYPRTYSYPKILIYAAAFLVFQRYVARPTNRRLAVMAVMIAVAFLFRHDHGLLLGFGGALTVALATPSAAPFARLRRVGILTLSVAVLLLPFLIYVQMSEGLWLYLRTGIEFSRREATHSTPAWPRFAAESRPYGVLISIYHALPWIAVAAAFALRKRDHREPILARIVPIAAVAVLVNLTFLRDPPVTRVPDPIVPAVVLGAWLMKQVQVSAHRRLLLPIALAVVVAAAWATVLAGDTLEQIDRMSLTSLGSVTERVAERTGELRARFGAHQIPTHTVAAMAPFFGYLDRCTLETDRLLIAGFLPEVPYFARRAFAGGQYVFMFGYFASGDNQRQVVERLRRQHVPFILIPSNYAKDFDQDFPLVHAYVVPRYELLTTVDVDEDLTVSVLVDHTRPQGARDRETGWPCFREDVTPR